MERKKVGLHKQKWVSSILRELRRASDLRKALRKSEWPCGEGTGLTPSVFLSNSTARREPLRGRRRPTRRGAGAGRACAPPVQARAAPGAAEEVPGEAGASGTAGEGESRPARKDEEGAGGTLPVLCVVPAVPRRHHPQVRGCVRGGAGLEVGGMGWCSESGRELRFGPEGAGLCGRKHGGLRPQEPGAVPGPRGAAGQAGRCSPRCDPERLSSCSHLFWENAAASAAPEVPLQVGERAGSGSGRKNSRKAPVWIQRQ